MKHVRESLKAFNDYKFFRIFEEDEKAELQDKEKDGLAVIDKITKNFEDFKKGAKGEILAFKEFWEENKKTKEGFTETGDVYKMFDSDYVIGVLELPVETLSDGSIDGGMGATDEPEEEIIEGPEIGAETEEPVEAEEAPKEDFFEEQMVPNPTNEAEGEEEDPDLDLGLGDEESGDISGELDTPAEEPAAEEPAPEPNAEIPAMDEPTEDLPQETDVTGDENVPDDAMPPEDSTQDLTAPQTYFVVYDISGEGREEIFRCGSNNVVNAFKAFYNDTFKGSMKTAILNYKQAKELEKKEAEKAEKAKVQTDKQSKVKKFLSESEKSYLNAVHTVSKLND